MHLAATDLRLQQLGFEAIGIWVMLMQLILEYGADGFLRFGSDNGLDLAGVARFRFHMSETELVTHLVTHSKTQMLTWCSDTMTLGFPPELALSKRTIANRENGRKGGRPTKKELERRNDQAQRSLPPMVIKGGKTVSADKTQKTQTQNSGSKLSLASTNSLEAKADAHAIDELYAELGPAAFAAGGFDEARSMARWDVARQWAADGLAKGLSADDVVAIVVETIKPIAERERARGAEVRSLMYFRGAVEKAIAKGDVPMREMTYAERAAEDQYCADYHAFLAAKMRGEVVPEPVLSEYRARARAA